MVGGAPQPARYSAAALPFFAGRFAKAARKYAAVWLRGFFAICSGVP